jgi:hypothetical protein
LIPTRYKARLPRHLSYPVGAESISEALAGIPHFESFSLRFSAEAVWPASEFRRLLVEQLPYCVMAAEHRPRSKPGLGAADHMVQAGWYDEKWELRVNPVLSRLRQTANQLLREVGMPAIAAWMNSSGQEGWRTRSHRIELVFSPADGSLATRRSDGV